MDVRAELGEFLQTRRARLQPEDSGLTTYGERRRVPGLRREELAQLAGVSVSYYTRLEQGQSSNASEEVLDAIAAALRLDADERDYLMQLARPRRNRRRAVPVEHAGPQMRQLLDAMSNTPAVLLNIANDVLAWNRLGHAFWAGHLDFDSPERPADRPNMSLLLFLDGHYRGIYVDWKTKARDNVASLRMLSGQSPDHPRLTAVIGELTVKSPEFAALWSAHPVRLCRPHRRVYQHPSVGRVTLHQEELVVQAETHQRLVLTSAEPRSPSAEALQLLAHLAASREPQRARGAAHATG